MKAASDNSLFGIKYWAQVFPKRIPRFEVFLYVGYDVKAERFLFRSRNERNIIYKSLTDLYRGDFQPFLLELSKIEPYYYGEKQLTDSDGDGIIE